MRQIRSARRVAARAVMAGFTLTGFTLTGITSLGITLPGITLLWAVGLAFATPAAHAGCYDVDASGRIVAARDPAGRIITYSYRPDGSRGPIRIQNSGALACEGAPDAPAPQAAAAGSGVETGLNAGGRMGAAVAPGGGLVTETGVSLFGGQAIDRQSRQP